MHFKIYEHDNVHAQLSWACKVLLPRGHELTQKEPAQSTPEIAHEPVNQVEQKARSYWKCHPQVHWNLMTFTIKDN